MIGNFWKKSAEIKVNGQIPLILYESKRSSLRVAIADVSGPMVKGKISFVTETDCNNGFPHTLEHLVFMGSERLPYKGILDLIANRCLASGTNAQTDQDNTSYSLTTVGSKGFINVLPVYLDHLLSPNITESQYATEVHHINGEGEDGGVVYSELQDYESDMEFIIQNKRRALLYPPCSSYAVNTAGKLEDIRSSCSLSKIKDYHKQYYHLKNLLITVCGKINHNDLLAAIKPIEDRELNKIPLNFKRPFQTAIPLITEERSAKIMCPVDDETKGIVEIAWLGPPASAQYTLCGLFVLFDYLTDTAIAPLQRDFIQISDPYCSSVYIYLAEQSTCEIIMNFSGVPTNKLEAIKQRFFDKTFFDHLITDNFDIERIGFIIDQLIRQLLTKMESNASSEIFNALSGFQLYDNSIEQLRIRLNEIETLNKLKKEPISFWQKLFVKTFTRNCVCVMGEPSASAVNEYIEKEKNRLMEQRERLGENGLKECAKKLNDYIKINTDSKPNAELLNDFIVKDLENFNTFDIKTNFNFEPNNPFKLLPFSVIHHNISSDFVDMNFCIDLKNVPNELRHFLMLWFELIFQSPAIIDGQILGFEEVSKLTTRDLVLNRISIGINGFYDRFLSLRLRVDKEKYENLPKWTEIFLKNIVFDSERIAICAKKLANSAADLKRDGSTVVSFLSTKFSYKPESNSNFFNYISLEKFHKSIADQIEKKKENEVIEKLNQVRRTILNCPINVHFACDISKILITPEENAKLWNFIKPDKHAIFDCPSEFGCTWEHSGISNVIAVGGTESSFLLQKTEFPQDWNGESIIETLLLTQYISQCEGPLWNAIRGKGLAYNASIYLTPDRKCLTLSLYRCSQIGETYEQTKQVVMDIIKSGYLDESQFEAAKRSLVCDLIGAQGTVKLAIFQAILSTTRKVNNSFEIDLCEKIWNLKQKNVLLEASQHIAKLFEDKNCIRSIAVNPSKLSDVRKYFPNINILKIDNLQVKTPKF